MRVVAALVLVVVAAGACSRTRVKPLRLEITRTGDAVDFESSERFAGISCSIYHWAHAEGGGGPGALRYIWRAHCPGKVDCATVVRYGDARLQNVRLFANDLAQLFGLPAQFFVRDVLQTSVLLVDLVDDRLDLLPVALVSCAEYGADDSL